MQPQITDIIHRVEMYAVIGPIPNLNFELLETITAIYWQQTFVGKLTVFKPDGSLNIYIHIIVVN